jgi:hypothetical protein
MRYEDFEFKIPVEADDYQECSEYVVSSIEGIIQRAIDIGNNKIFINTNLKRGLPMENINKVAGPFIEAWAYEVFYKVLEDGNNKYDLINVEAQERLSKSDIILQFRKVRKVELGITAEVDVKATSEDIVKSGKAPNITSYARIRTAYVENPDYIFIVLSLKHKVYSTRDDATGLMNGIMEVVSQNAYDLKFLSSKDFSCNPALGTGQIQIRDIHYVKLEERTTWEFVQLLDRKYFASVTRNVDSWHKMAVKFGWIKLDV